MTIYPYISPDGTPKASTVKPPKLLSLVCTENCMGECGDVCPVISGNRKQNDKALRQWKDGCLDFEDQEAIKKLLPNDAWGRSPQDPDWNPDTIPSVELEGEVVEIIEIPKYPNGNHKGIKQISQVIRLK